MNASALTCKSLQDRIEECINIKTQLRSLGALMNDMNRGKIARLMNSYVKEATTGQLKVRIDDTTNAIIALHSNVHKRSGITLERM